MASKRSYVDHLGSIPLFSGCSQRDLQKIAKASTETTVSAGRELVRQGDQGREAFVVFDGSATVKRNGRKIATLGPGDYIGELSLLDKGPRTASVTADTDMQVLVLTAREFSGLLDSLPSLAHKMMAALAERIRQLDSKLIE